VPQRNQQQTTRGGENHLGEEKRTIDSAFNGGEKSLTCRAGLKNGGGLLMQKSVKRKEAGKAASRRKRVLPAQKGGSSDSA